MIPFKKEKAILSAMALVAIVSGVLVGRDPPAGQAGQPTPLPFVPALAMEGVTPGPTMTPIPSPPADSPLINADAAREIGSVAAQGTVQSDSVAVHAARTGGFENYFPSRDQDYPIWVFTAEGRFRASTGNVASEFTSARAFIDAVNGEVMSVELRGEIPVGSRSG